MAHLNNAANDLLKILKQPLLLVLFATTAALSASQAIAGDIAGAAITTSAGATVVTLLNVWREARSNRAGDVAKG